MSDALTPTHAANYLKTYIEAYRREFARFTQGPPAGPGYPPLLISPYLREGAAFSCLIANDGTAVIHFGEEPPHHWHIAGGPALMPDTEPSRTPQEILDLLDREGIRGKSIGIYRIVGSVEDLTDEVWEGRLPPALDSCTITLQDRTTIEACRVDLSWRELAARLTFGAFERILDTKLPAPDSPYWVPGGVKSMGFVTADRKFRRFFGLLELSPHVTLAAWDPLSVNTRVHADVRRDFASVQIPDPEGVVPGALLVSGPNLVGGMPEATLIGRLPLLEEGISRLRVLLATEPPPDEPTFHRLFDEFPLLLDVYAEAHSKPRFTFPEKSAGTSKTYVEPDFVLVEELVSGRNYTLIEIERPSKAMVTRAGHPRAELTQAASQIGEWKAYIDEHYDAIRDRFPGITSHRAVLIMSRAQAEQRFAGGDIREGMTRARRTFSADEILLYDDVLERAQRAYNRLVGVIPTGPS